MFPVRKTRESITENWILCGNLWLGKVNKVCTIFKHPQNSRDKRKRILLQPLQHAYDRNEWDIASTYFSQCGTSSYFRKPALH